MINNNKIYLNHFVDVFLRKPLQHLKNKKKQLRIYSCSFRLQLSVNRARARRSPDPAGLPNNAGARERGRGTRSAIINRRVGYGHLLLPSRSWLLAPAYRAGMPRSRSAAAPLPLLLAANGERLF